MSLRSLTFRLHPVASSKFDNLWPLHMRSSASIRRMPVTLRQGSLKCMPKPMISHSQQNENEIMEGIEAVRRVLSSIEDGDISISSYDTAWVSLIENIENPGVPKFPSCLEWITMNQLKDGSWGDKSIFLAHDRILGTLTCVVALKTWNSNPEKIQKGLKFVVENIGKLEGEDAQHMPVGFEVILPKLLKMAKSLGMAEVADMPCIQHIYDKRELKLAKIPKEVLHNIPTSLLFSLEGMEGLDWTKLLKLQCEDGSFLFSLASTASAFMQTKDEKCLKFIKNIVQKFEMGVPFTYPITMYERLWAVDKVKRLGISRHFQAEIMDCLGYVYRFWSDKGLGWTEPHPVKDLDVTSMGFRLLRLYGFEVSADVIRKFKEGDEFVCYAGQILEAPTVMFNVFRGSEIQFPGETILEEARHYSYDFLRRKRACGAILDKWMLLKDLTGEICYALDVPWHASLPRLEARVFIDQYGGANDACIGKNIYRLPKIANDSYLELAKLDYNKCQAIHQQEFRAMKVWFEENKILGVFGISKRDLLVSYYLAAASIFEPERCVERLAWAKSSIFVVSVISYLQSEKNITSNTCKKTIFLDEFLSKVVQLINGASNETRISSDSYDSGSELVFSLLRFLHNLSNDIQVVTRAESLTILGQAWKKWLLSLEGGYKNYGDEAELLVQTISICTGGTGLIHNDYAVLSSVTNKFCTQLRNKQIIEKEKLETVEDGARGRMSGEIELGMQQVVQLVLTKSGLGEDVKKVFFAVATGFYYMAYFDPKMVDQHIAKVLFERVE